MDTKMKELFVLEIARRMAPACDARIVNVATDGPHVLVTRRDGSAHESFSVELLYQRYERHSADIADAMTRDEFKSYRLLGIDPKFVSTGPLTPDTSDKFAPPVGLPDRSRFETAPGDEDPEGREGRRLDTED